MISSGSKTNSGSRKSSLDLSIQSVSEIARQIDSLVLDYFSGITSLPIFPQDASLDRLEILRNASCPMNDEPLENIIADCRIIINSGRQNGHPRFFGYVASPSTPIGAYADLLASAINQNVTSWRSTPAATEVEKTVIRWLASLIGYADTAAGLLTSGGSMANLNAVYAAHRAKAPGDPSRHGLLSSREPMLIYASDQVHHSIIKAADILGLGTDQVRLVPSDDKFRLDVRILRDLIEADLLNGNRPFCVVASAGTVNTGAIDPLNEVASVCDDHNLWFHIDGAYGAPGFLDETKRNLFRGIDRADSISLDPHKWLYAPVDCGCLLYRNPERYRGSWQAPDADYIKIHEETEEESFAFWDYGVELSRRFRALKIWMMLRYYGVRRVAAAISEDMAVAKALAKSVTDAEDFELAAPVELSICCFRYLPLKARIRLKAGGPDERARLNGEVDLLNARIMKSVQRGGRAYISNATLKGRFALRACVTNFRTTRDDMAQTLEIIREAGRGQ